MRGIPGFLLATREVIAVAGQSTFLQKKGSLMDGLLRASDFAKVASCEKGNPQKRDDICTARKKRGFALKSCVLSKGFIFAEIPIPD